METQKILIADDDREHLLMLAFVLRKAGYQVISSFDAKNALQLAVEQDPDLLLLDIHLGDEDGFAVQERLQKIDELAGTPVIYLTGDQSNWVQRMTDAVGAYAVVGKPFEIESLLSTIRSALSRKRNSSNGQNVSPLHVKTATNAHADMYIG